MQIDKIKLRKLWGYFALGFACIVCAILLLVDIGNNKKSNDFAKLEVHISRPLKFSKGGKGSHISLEITTK